MRPVIARQPRHRPTTRRSYIDLDGGIQGHVKGLSRLEQLLDEYSTKAFGLD